MEANLPRSAITESESSDDGLFHDSSPTTPAQAERPQAAGEDEVENATTYPPEFKYKAPPIGVPVDVPVKAPPGSQDSPSRTPAAQTRWKDPPKRPPVVQPVDPWQNSDDPLYQHDPWSQPRMAKAPPQQYGHVPQEVAPPQPQMLNQVRPPPPPKSHASPPKSQQTVQNIPKPPPKQNNATNVPKPPPKPPPPPKVKAPPVRDVFWDVQQRVEIQSSMAHGNRPPVPPTPYMAPPTPQAQIQQSGPAPPAPAGSQEANWYKLFAWVPDEKGKFIFCFMLSEGVQYLSQNASAIYAAVLGEDSAEVVDDQDNYRDDVMERNLQNLCRWDAIFMMRLYIPSGPFEGMAAVGVGSNVKIRTRAAKLALAVTVRIAMIVSLNIANRISHVQDFEVLVTYAKRRRQFDITHFEKSAEGMSASAPTEFSREAPQQLVPNFSGSDSVEAASSIRSAADELVSSMAGTRLLQKAVQNMNEQPRHVQPPHSLPTVAHQPQPPFVGKSPVATWDMPQSTQPRPPPKAPPQSTNTSREVEELLRQGIPQEVLDSPFVELRPYEGNAPYPFCTLCNKWADGSHMGSKTHVKKAAWYDPSWTSPVTSTSAPRTALDSTSSWGVTNAGVDPWDPWHAQQTQVVGDAENIQASIAGQPDVVQSFECEVLSTEPPVFPAEQLQQPVHSIPDFWDELEPPHADSHQQDVDVPGAIHIGDDDNDVGLQPAPPPDAVGLPASWIGRVLNLTPPTWKELDDWNMPRYYALGFDPTQVTIESVDTH